jgi:hypothetical protein
MPDYEPKSIDLRYDVADSLEVINLKMAIKTLESELSFYKTMWNQIVNLFNMSSDIANKHLTFIENYNKIIDIFTH